MLTTELMLMTLPPASSNNFAAACVATLMISAIFFSALLYLPQFMAKQLGFSAVGAGAGGAAIFTTGGYEDNIQIKPHSREITEQACRNCHEEIVGAIEPAHPTPGGQLTCLRCHESVGHLH